MSGELDLTLIRRQHALGYGQCHVDELIAEVERLRAQLLAGATPEGQQPPVFGLWAAHDRRRIFVEGAKWWEFKENHATMWPSDVDLVEAEAERRYPNGGLPAPPAPASGDK